MGLHGGSLHAGTLQAVLLFLSIGPGAWRMKTLRAYSTALAGFWAARDVIARSVGWLLEGLLIDLALASEQLSST
jgi:hypothetical protein